MPVLALPFAAGLTYPGQAVEVPLMGRAEAIALYAFVQLLFVTFAFAGPLMAAYGEWRWKRTGAGRYLRLHRDLARASFLLFGAGAVATLLFLFVGALFWPDGIARLFALYFWPAALIGLFYLVEAMLLAYYVYAWQSAGTRLHLALGLSAALVGCVGLVNLNSAVAAAFAALPDIAGAQRGLNSFVDRFAFLPLDIPGWGPLALYRSIGALSFAGLFLATIAAILQLRGGSSRSQAYLTFLSGQGLRFGLFPLLALPLVGGLYLLQAPVASAGELGNIVIGGMRWVISAQLVLLALLLFLANWYVVRALRGVRAEGSQVVGTWMYVAGMLAVTGGGAAAWYAYDQGQTGVWEAWGVVGLLVALYALAMFLFDAQQAAAGPAGDWAGAVGVLLPLVSLCAVVLVVPFNLLLGDDFLLTRLWPWQTAALIGLCTLVIPSAALFARAAGRGLLAGRASPPVLQPVMTALAAVCLMFALGYVRDIAVTSYVLSRQLLAADEIWAAALAAAPFSPAVGLWLVTFAVLAGTVIVWQVLPVLRQIVAEEVGESRQEA